MEPWSLGCSEANPQATAASELAEKSRASDPGFDRHLETNRMAVLWLPGLWLFLIPAYYRVRKKTTWPIDRETDDQHG